MLPCVWLLLIPDLVASLTTDDNRDAREEDDTTHGSDKSKLTLDFLLTPHGTLLVVFVGEGRNDPRWLRVHDDDDGPPNTTDASALQPCSVFVDSVIYIFFSFLCIILSSVYLIYFYVSVCVCAAFIGE